MCEGRKFILVRECRNVEVGTIVIGAVLAKINLKDQLCPCTQGKPNKVHFLWTSSEWPLLIKVPHRDREGRNLDSLKITGQIL